MLTTIQVRNIMRRHIGSDTIYTNKTSAKPEVRERSVKCYFVPGRRSHEAMLDELRSVVNARHIKVVPVGQYGAAPGLVVRAVLPE